MRKLSNSKKSLIKPRRSKNELIQSVEKKYEEDILVRMQKLGNKWPRKLEKRAQEIITTAIQRLGNSVASDVMATTSRFQMMKSKVRLLEKKAEISRLLNALRC
jgi:polyhydroxyalkanoate synthesis regulator phasin